MLIFAHGDGPGSRRLVDQLVFELFELSVRKIVQVGVIVGPALGASDFRESALYAPDYDRRYRPGGTVGSAV